MPYVFMTPEYNHGVPGAFKNAVDLLGPEWVGKAIGFVSYGSAEGVRAVEQWRQIVANFSMFDVRAQASLSNFTEFAPDGTRLSRVHGVLRDLNGLLNQLIGAAEKLDGREPDAGHPGACAGCPACAPASDPRGGDAAGQRIRPTLRRCRSRRAAVPSTPLAPRRCPRRCAQAG